MWNTIYYLPLSRGEVRSRELQTHMFPGIIVRLILFVYELYDILVLPVCDVSNAYIKANIKEKVYIFGSPEIGLRERHIPDWQNFPVIFAIIWIILPPEILLLCTNRNLF